MRLILEGPDNAGKTTLARMIQDACPKVKYYHPGGRPESFNHEQVCVVEQAKALHHGNCILDRITPISQQIYNPDRVLDRIRNLELKSLLHIGSLDDHYRMCEGLLPGRPVVVYCRPSTDRLMRVEDFSWRDGETEEHKQKIIVNQHAFINAYDAIMQTVPNVCYDFDSSTGPIIVSKLIRAFSGFSDDEAWFYQLMDYRGQK